MRFVISCMNNISLYTRLSVLFDCCRKKLSTRSLISNVPSLEHRPGASLLLWNKGCVILSEEMSFMPHLLGWVNKENSMSASTTPNECVSYSHYGLKTKSERRVRGAIVGLRERVCQCKLWTAGAKFIDKFLIIRLIAERVFYSESFGFCSLTVSFCILRNTLFNYTIFIHWIQLILFIVSCLTFNYLLRHREERIKSRLCCDIISCCVLTYLKINELTWELIHKE